MIHPVFHISQLEPAPTIKIPNCNNLPPPPIEVEGNLEFKLTQILDSKWDKGRRNPLQYYVRWASYKGTPEEYSWLNAIDVKMPTLSRN